MNDTQERIQNCSFLTVQNETDPNISYVQQSKQSEEDQSSSSGVEGGMLNRRNYFYNSKPDQKKDEEDDEYLEMEGEYQMIQQWDNKEMKSQIQNQSCLKNKLIDEIQLDSNRFRKSSKQSTKNKLSKDEDISLSRLELVQENQNNCNSLRSSNNEIKFNQSSKEIQINLSGSNSFSPKKKKGNYPRLSDLARRIQIPDDVTVDNKIRYLVSDNCNQEPQELIQLKEEYKQLEEIPTIQKSLKDKIGERNVTQNIQLPQAEGLSGPWKHSSLLIITLIKKFQNMLMSHNNQNKFRCLEKEHFDVIGDRSVYYEYYLKYKKVQDTFYKKKKGKKMGFNIFNRQASFPQQEDSNYAQLKYLYENVVKYFMSVQVIQPNSSLKILWNILLFLLIIINFFTISVKLSFSNLFFESDNKLTLLTYLSSIIFVLDMIINFNSAYFSKGLIIRDRKKIMNNYFKNNLLFDCVTLCSYFIAIFFSPYQIEAAVLIRTFKLAPLIENFEEILNLKQRGQAILSLAKLIMFIVMVTHILGCSFYLFARLESIYLPLSSNWISDKYSWQTQWYDQYVVSLYWSVVTMITVGYGDITPVNTQERLFVIIVMLISCGVFAYSINSIGRILEELSKRDAIFRDNISLVTFYLKQRGISYDLQLRIRKYFQYLHKENLEDSEKSEGLMDLLPSSLKNELGLEMYVKIINDQKIFKLNFSQQFISHLSLKMKEKRLGPEEIIFQERDYLDKLYFVIKGSVQLFVNIQDSNDHQYTSIGILNKGRLLGQGAFFSQLPCTTNARCINVTSLVFVNKQDFIETIKLYPKDYEKYCMLRDNFRINNISRGLGTKCHLCGSFNHSFLQCQIVRYTPTKEKVILRYNQSTLNRDSLFVRNIFRKKQSNIRFKHEQLKDAAINFLLDSNANLNNKNKNNIKDINTNYIKDNIINDDDDEDDEEEEEFQESILEVVNNIKQYYLQEQLLWSKFPLQQQKNYSQLNIDASLSDSNSQISKRNFNDLEQVEVPQSTQPNDNSNQIIKESYISNDSILTTTPVLIPQSMSILLRNKRKSLEVEDNKNKKNQVTKQITNQSLNANEISAANEIPLPNIKKKRFQENSFGSQDSFSMKQNFYLKHGSSTLIQPTAPPLSNFNDSQNLKVYKKITSINNSQKNDNSQCGMPLDIQSSYQYSKLKQLRKRGNMLGGIEEEQQMRKIFFSDLEELDRYQIFEIYFIEGNINKILDSYNNNFIHIKEDWDIQTKKKYIKRLMTKRSRHSTKSKIKTSQTLKKAQTSQSNNSFLLLKQIAYCCLQVGTYGTNQALDSPVSDKQNRSFFYQHQNQSSEWSPMKQKSFKDPTLIILPPKLKFTSENEFNLS